MIQPYILFQRCVTFFQCEPVESHLFLIKYLRCVLYSCYFIVPDMNYIILDPHYIHRTDQSCPISYSNTEGEFPLESPGIRQPGKFYAQRCFTKVKKPAPKIIPCIWFFP